MNVLAEKIKSFFKLSDLPPKAKKLMEDEGLLFLAEGVRITVHYKLFKAPGKYFRNKRETSWGSLAVSRKRIVGYVGKRRAVHLPLDREEVKSAKFSLVDGRVFVIEMDPSISDPRRSGSIQIRYHMQRAPEAYRLIMDLTCR